MSQIANPNLKWETNYNMNIGLDFGFWNRLNSRLNIIPVQLKLINGLSYP